MDESSFDYRCPQYMEDMQSHLQRDDGADAFFDVISEEVDLEKGVNTPERASPIENFMTPCENLGEVSVKKKQVRIESTINEHISQELVKKHAIQTLKLKERRSLMGKKVIMKARRRWSTNAHGREDIQEIMNVLTENLKKKMSVTKKTTFDGIELLTPPHSAKKHSMVTRQDMIGAQSTFDLRGRSVTRSCRKRCTIGVSPAAGSPPRKYFSLAESIFHFQKDTPPRFHTSKKTSQCILPVRLRPTIAKTPVLETAGRSRPHDILSQEERELKVINDYKQQPLYHPLNENVIKRPQIIKPQHKTPTIPKPFKITEIVKKDPEEIEESNLFVFKAKPVPKTNKIPAFPLRRRCPVTKEQEDATISERCFLDRGIKTTSKINQSCDSFSSSYYRGVEMLKKKEEKIKKYLEAEKKAREFHAKPLPSYLLKSSRNTTVDSTSSYALEKAGKENVEQKPFKATYPSVLHKPPFQLKRAEKTITEPIELELNTECRARKREEFDRMVAEKQELKAQEEKQVVVL